jgi:flavin-dependent dehydrogenase
MAKAPPQPDVLVLGDHPAGYLTAAVLRQKGKLRVLHATIPGEVDRDRLVVINPSFFSLNPALEPIKRKLELNTIYGLQFLSGDPAVRSEYRSKSAMGYIGSSKAIRAAVATAAAGEGVELVTPRTLEIERVDERGVDVALGKARLHPTMLVVAGTLPAAQQKLLGIPESWEREVIHRYTYVKIPGGTKGADVGARPTMPMCLNLRGQLCWGWLLPGPKSMQLAVEQPAETIGKLKPTELLADWVEILRTNEVIAPKASVPLESAESIDLPLAGALAHEGVANRTLLVGPAGGFYSACAEDIYPNSWSALFAADAIKKALKEPHLQDALNPYRQKWRTTLGDYLRGPQQNLRFLLPLVYRNQVMTTRLSESILLGKSVVR